VPPVSKGMGQPGFPTLSLGGRVREGSALKQGDGETRFPHPPARGRVWESYALKQGCGATGFPHTLTRWEGGSGRRLRTGVWGNRVSPRPHPRVRAGYALKE